MLAAGTYNAGLVGVSDRQETRRFLAAWHERCLRHPVAAPERGLNYDQRWLDLAPGLVEDLHVVRDASINAGHWRLPDPTPPRIMHFSGFDPRRPGRVAGTAS